MGIQEHMNKPFIAEIDFDIIEFDTIEEAFDKVEEVLRGRNNGLSIHRRIKANTFASQFVEYDRKKTMEDLLSDGDVTLQLYGRAVGTIANISTKEFYEKSDKERALSLANLNETLAPTGLQAVAISKYGTHEELAKEGITKFSWTQTVRDVDCPKCKQKKGDQCRQPKGRKAWPPHVERITAYSRYCDSISPDEFMRRHGVDPNPPNRF